VLIHVVRSASSSRSEVKRMVNLVPVRLKSAKASDGPDAAEQPQRGEEALSF
jgi:hypothetical protein